MVFVFFQLWWCLYCCNVLFFKCQFWSQYSFLLLSLIFFVPWKCVLITINNIFRRIYVLLARTDEFSCKKTIDLIENIYNSKEMGQTLVFPRYSTFLKFSLECFIECFNLQLWNFQHSENENITRHNQTDCFIWLCQFAAIETFKSETSVKMKWNIIYRDFVPDIVSQIGFDDFLFEVRR